MHKSTTTIKDKQARDIILRSADEKDAESLLDFLKITAAETPFLLREPDEIAFASSAMVGFVSELTSLAADMIVIVIFVPVSPSGTGNTFSSFIQSFFESRFLAPARNILARSFELMLVISTFCSPP